MYSPTVDTSTRSLWNGLDRQTLEPSAQQAKFGVIAIVGRPNVGKSTLFNRLCGNWEALVHDAPGLTRDRRYGIASRIGEGVSVVDTGGLCDTSDIADKISAQTSLAIDESDLVLFLLDAREGITLADQEIAADLRRRSSTVVPVVNKIDGVKNDVRIAITGEVSALGFGAPQETSASHNKGVSKLAKNLESLLPLADTVPPADGITVAVIGRPNVGKSTLVNAFAGEPRCVVYDEPGTTRDSVQVSVSGDSGRYHFIDTAGVRRRARVDGSVEKFSIVQALAAMKKAQVALLIVDASEGIVDQDLHLTGHAIESGSGIVVVVNKWDKPSDYEKQHVRNELSRRLRFAPWVPFKYVSALRQTGLRSVLKEVDRVHATGLFDVSTPELNRALEEAVAAHSPPSIRGRTVKLRYANKIGSFPPALLIHGNQAETLPSSYRKYLENRFREAFDLRGMPLKLVLRTSSNPFGDLRNRLTPRQFSRRQSLIRHRKRHSRRA